MAKQSTENQEVDGSGSLRLGLEATQRGVAWFINTDIII